MKRLFTIDLHDYDDSFSRFIRPSVRGIILKDKKAAMVYSNKYDYYKFPGGGIENDEDHINTLIREISEETGLKVIKKTLREYGSVLRIQKSRFAENVIFEQENFYYLCNVENSANSQSLDDYELDEGFELRYVSADEAINVNRSHDHADYDATLIERESRVLELLVKDDLL